jgi:enoyl-CoA hydratase/carnithine racemase
MDLLGEGTVTELDGVIVRREPPAGRLILNRPEKRNALSLELMLEATAVLRELGRDSTIRAIVIEGAGPAFSGGHDLAEMIGRDLPFYQELFDVCTELMQTIHRLPQPVIARVHGIATAAGCQLVATCDLAVATEDARFGTSGVRTGLFCTTPGVAVSRSIGRKQALEMLLTGELVDAQTALRWGLVNRVVPAEELDEAVQEFVDSIARLSPYALAVGKEAFYRHIDLDEQHAYELAKSVMSTNACAADAQEGISAFLEKRPATWKGK